MDKLLATGSHLEGRFRVSGVIGHGDESAAYLAADLEQDGAWVLIWESLGVFRMQRKPEGALRYLVEHGRHYLVLRLEGQDLGLVHSAAGVVAEGWAALWMAQVCDSIGQWHNRRERPLVCLEEGEVRLAAMRLMATGRAIVPGCDVLSESLAPSVPGQALSFSAPEKAAGAVATPRSDVYALGAALYCLVTGTPPPPPQALAAGEAELIPPRKAQRDISGRMDRIIRKAMSLKPGERYESAMQLSFELQRCVPRQLRRYIGVV